MVPKYRMHMEAAGLKGTLGTRSARRAEVMILLERDQCVGKALGKHGQASWITDPLNVLLRT